MNRLVTLLMDLLSQTLIGIIEFCIKHMFQDINDGMALVVNASANAPAALMPEAFTMIKTLSDNVLLPLSSIVISFILTYELITMVIDKNNMHEVDSALLAKYLFKAAVSVFLLSKCYEITMAVFDVGALRQLFRYSCCLSVMKSRWRCLMLGPISLDKQDW